MLVTKGNPLNLRQRQRQRSDLDERSIAIHSGNLSDEKLALEFPRSRIVPLETPDEVIDAVATGRVDATFDNGSRLYRANRIDRPYLQFVFDLDRNLDLAFGVSKDWPLAISILDKGLAALGDDERTRIQARCFLAPLTKPLVVAVHPQTVYDGILDVKVAGGLPLYYELAIGVRKGVP